MVRVLTQRRKNQAAQPRVSDIRSPEPYLRSADSEALDPQTPAIMHFDMCIFKESDDCLVMCKEHERLRFEAQVGADGTGKAV